MQRDHVLKDEASCPTASTDSILIASTIDARQRRDILTVDVPNAFVQTEMPQKDKGEIVIMKIKGIFVKILCEIGPESYMKFITFKNNKPKLYISMIKALSGMLVSVLLY